MPKRVSQSVKVIGLIVVGVVLLVGLSAAAMPHVKEWIKPAGKDESATEKANSSVVLDDKAPDTLRFTGRKAMDDMGVRTAPVEAVTQGRVLELNGSLAPDTDKLLPVRSRFPGEVMDIGKVPDRDKQGRSKERDVGNGDRVRKGELLAVVWSKDLGLTKSQLLDALSKLRRDRITLDKYNELFQKGAIPERSVRDAERDVESDKIAVRAAELTLRSWRLTDAEIKEIHAEADQLAKLRVEGKGADENPGQWEKWARVEVRAPFDGTIVEKNVALGAIVDTTTNLFIISDLSHLTVWAHIFEEDLPALLKLRREKNPEPIAWAVRVQNEPRAKPMQGAIQEIRPLIDPNTHTALVKGRVENREGQLVSGAFITATVQLPPPADEVKIPTSALVEDGQEDIVFVQPDEGEPRLTMLRVAVARRGRDWVQVRSTLSEQEKRDKLQPLRQGQRVVTSGALLLQSALKDLQDKAKEQPDQGKK